MIIRQAHKNGGRAGGPGVEHKNKAFQDRIQEMYSMRPKMPRFHAAENSRQVQSAWSPCL